MTTRISDRVLPAPDTYPPTPEQFGVLFSRYHLLAEQLQTLMLAATRALPDVAPFDMNDWEAHLWQVLMDSERLLTRCEQGPRPLPWQDPADEEDECHD